VNGVLAVSRSFGDFQFKSFDSGDVDLLSPNEKSFSVNSNRVEVLERSRKIQSQSLVIAEPEIRSELITPKTEFAIIATDGLWDVIAPQQAITFVRSRMSKSKDLQKVLRELVNEALHARNSQDNITVILVTFHSSFTSLHTVIS
jgi:serine/threonine protein phosphatase PrpC